jgi:hypothetical protein
MNCPLCLKCILNDTQKANMWRYMDDTVGSQLGFPLWVRGVRREGGGWERTECECAYNAPQIGCML